MDKFYTTDITSKKYIDIVGDKYKWNKWDLIIEPSAGSGSFLKKIPSNNKIGIDIEPEDNSIIKQDYFEYKPDKKKQNILVIGNPPFGRVSSLAVKFFNHSAEFAKIIAFIVPRTFRRISVQNKLNQYFHLIYDDEIPITPCSFEPKMSAKCCFQIWEKRKNKREIIVLEDKHQDWDFLTYTKDENNKLIIPEDADFAIKAYGSNCGKIQENEIDKLSPKSWHWIKANIDKETLINNFNNLNYEFSKDTARQDSIGRKELVKLYNEKYDYLPEE